MTKKVIRQGDVYLIKVDSLPKGLKEKDKVLARGEVTGHQHQLTSTKTKVMVDNKGNQYASVTETDTLVHEEHADLTIPSGLYAIRLQREFSPLEGIRQVMD